MVFFLLLFHPRNNSQILKKKRPVKRFFFLVHQQQLLAAYDTEVLQMMKDEEPATPIIKVTHRVSVIEMNVLFSFYEYDRLWYDLGWPGGGGGGGRGGRRGGGALTMQV